MHNKSDILFCIRRGISQSVGVTWVVMNKTNSKNPLIRLVFFSILLACNLSIDSQANNPDPTVTKNNPQAVLDLAKRTLEFVQKQEPRPRFAQRLTTLEKEFYKATNDKQLDDLATRISSLRRQIILSHPLLDFDKLLINKRPPASHHMVDQYLGRRSGVGPGLAVLENWKDKAKEKILLEGKLPTGSVLHPDLSFDGKRVLFSFCDHSVTFGQKNWKWKLPDKCLRRFLVYEIGIDGTGLRQVTGNANDPMLREGNRNTVLIEDYDPCYLPDGGFAFISTRCQSFGRCHGGRYVPAFTLYRGNLDGTGIRRISFGEANEWEPSVLHDGRLIYTRWDYINRHDFFYQSLWTIRPDGTGTAHYYGNYTINPCMTSEALAIPGSQKIVTTAMAHHGYTAGSIILIDPLKGRDGADPITRITPEVTFPETEEWPDSCFATPYPLSEDLFLVAYCPDKLAPYGSSQKDNAYSIYLIDTLGGREPIYRDPNISCFAPIPIRPRPKPLAIKGLAAPEKKSPTGVYFVKDVYNSAQSILPGTIKSLRINRIIVQPTRKKKPLSYAANEILKTIVGTVPVAEDGSVAFEAPASVPLQLQLLDKNNMAVMTMRSSIYLQPGEYAGCVGCHEHHSSSPQPAATYKDMTIHKPKPPAGPKYPGGFSFTRSVQPVLDRYCIDCHGLGDATEKLNLIGTKEGDYTKSYNALANKRGEPKGFVKIAYRNHETAYSTPNEYFANASKLAKILLNDHQDRVKLDDKSLQLIAQWLDLNAQFYGNYSWNRKEDSAISPEGETALRQHIRNTFGDTLADQPIDALINITMPNQSRILKAPLSTKANGWGQIKQNPWPTTNDPAYKKMQQLVNAAIVNIKTQDKAGTCNQEPCVCGCCWVKDGELLAAHNKK